MKFSVDQKIFEKWSEVKIGVVVLLGINNKDKNQEILNLLRTEEEKGKKELEGKDFNLMPEVAVWKDVYKNFGSNPREYRSSVEALLRRVRSGSQLPQINNLVDLYNYLSVKHHVPAGAEDLDKVQGNIELTFSKGNEAGKYIGSETVDTCYEGEVIYKDEVGFICRRWNWREGNRTKIEEQTQNSVLVFEAMPPVTKEQLDTVIEESCQLIKKYLGGEQKIFVLSKINPSLEITFTTGLKTVTEEVVPQKEENKSAGVNVRHPKGVNQTIKSKKELPPKEFVSYEIIQTLFSAVKNCYPDLELKMENIQLEHPVEESHGDYSSNVALKLKIQNSNVKSTSEKSKVSNEETPREIAEKIVKELRVILGSKATPESDLSVEVLPKTDSGQARMTKNIVSKIEIAGPGFINFWLSSEFLLNQINTIEDKKENFGQVNLGNNRTFIVEYSSPNIAKPFTIAHLLSTIIGFSLANIWSYAGFNVLRDNHLGDWGTQFGKMIYAIKNWGDEEKIKKSKNPVKELVELYVKFHEEVDKESAAKEGVNLETVEDTDSAKNRGTVLEEKAREWFKKLENHDPEARRLWKFCYDLSMKEFNRIYALLGVHFDMMLGESFFEDKMAEVIELAKKTGIAQDSKGALMIFFPENKLPPLMLLKSNGTTLYHTRDLACDNYRIKTWGKDILIMNETSLQQELYFKQLYWADELLGICKREQRIHIGHGTMRSPEGVMSTRKGNIIWLEDVLNQGIDKAKELMANSYVGNDLTRQEKDNVAKALGIGAIKYSQLSQNYKTDFIFTWEKALNLHGNSSAYLQYTYARAKSVLAKNTSSLSLRGRSETTDEAISKTQDMRLPRPSTSLGARNDSLLEAEELQILRTLYKFPEVVLAAAQNYAPNLICNYLYDLAQKFNTFYDKLPILKADKTSREVRLKITEATAQVLHNGLRLLGIDTPEKM